MIKLGKVKEIYKNVDTFMAKIHIQNTQSSERISIDEAIQLTPGDKIKIDVEWNEDGNGQVWTIVRPIEIYVKQDPKYRILR